MDPPVVLLIDDDEDILTVLEMRLEAAGHIVLTARDRAEALCGLAESQVDVAIADLRLGDDDGLDVMEALREVDPNLPVLILTAHGTIPNAVEAVRRGAWGYLTKPVDRQELFEQIGRCVEQRRARRPTASSADRNSLQGIIGSSPAMQRVFRLIEKVAPTRLVVTIEGESGTGKELVARAIHRLSPRADQPFLAINCAAMPDSLLQTELFGHKKGTFTGATADREGLFQRAHGGTLLLDEIGDMTPALQGALLRALQEGEVMPVGGREPVKVDVRVIVATHRDLRKLVEEEKFRQDLFYRVNVAHVHLPPLRERGDDVLLLAERFLERFAEQHGRPGLRLGEAARAALLAHAWPGNVRELQHAIERAVVMCIGEEIEVECLFPDGHGPGASPAGDEIRPLREARDAWERAYLERLLGRTGGNVSAAARLAGKYRADLYALLKKHGIDPRAFK